MSVYDTRSQQIIRSIENNNLSRANTIYDNLTTRNKDRFCNEDPSNCYIIYNYKCNSGQVQYTYETQDLQYTDCVKFDELGALLNPY